MKSPLALTIAAANRAGMTYGAYVSKYGIVFSDEKTKKDIIKKGADKKCEQSQS